MQISSFVFILYKKVEFDFYVVYILCKFEQNLSEEVVKDIIRLNFVIPSLCDAIFIAQRKRKTELLENFLCLLQTETENGSLFFLVGKR